MLVEVKNLELAYGDGPAVVKDLSFGIEKGDFICLVGRNGAGKSTLVKALLGILKPHAGEISYGIPKNAIGYMPQETKVDPHFPASAREIVATGFLNRETKKTVSEILKLLGISELEKTSFTRLSGGQRQKVLLARAVAAAGELLILDEPSNNLDATSRAELYALVKKLNKSGLSILMITHDLDHDNLLGNKILSLPDGFFGPTKAYVRKVHHA